MEWRSSSKTGLRANEYVILRKSLLPIASPRGSRAHPLDLPAALEENPATVRFDETEHGLNPWRARRCIRGRKLHD